MKALLLLAVVLVTVVSCSFVHAGDLAGASGLEGYSVNPNIDSKFLPSEEKVVLSDGAETMDFEYKDNDVATNDDLMKQLDEDIQKQKDVTTSQDNTDPHTVVDIASSTYAKMAIEQAENEALASQLEDETACPKHYKSVQGRCVRSSFLRCPRGYVRKDDACVALEPCPNGYYRQRVKCKKMPSTKTCEAEIRAMVKRNAQDDALRKQELAVIRTIRTLLEKLNNIKDIDEESKVAPQDLINLLQSVSEEDRRYAEVNGKNGIIELLNRVEAKLKKDLSTSRQELRELKRHCNSVCSVAVKAHESIVNQWAKKKSDMGSTVSSISRKVEKWQGKVKVLKTQYESTTTLHLKLKANRDRQLALINWLRKKVTEVRNVKQSDVQVSKEDLAAVLAGLDEDDTELLQVMTMMKRDFPELQEILKLLSSIEAKLKNDDKVEIDGINTISNKIQSWSAYITRLTTKRDAYSKLVTNIETKLKSSQKASHEQQLNCAAFGSLA